MDKIKEQLYTYAEKHYPGRRAAHVWTYEPENQRLVAEDFLYYYSTEDGRVQTVQYYKTEDHEFCERSYKLVKERVTLDAFRYWHYEDVLEAFTRDEIPQALWDEYHEIYAHEMAVHLNNFSYDTMTTFLHEGRISQSCFDAWSWLWHHSAVRFTVQRGGAPDALAIPFAFDYPMAEIEKFIKEA